MAHYAFLDENNIVTEVIVGKDEGEEGIDWEAHYGAFRGQTCKRTSYNTRRGVYYGPNGQASIDQSKAFRKNYAAIGFAYDTNRNAFIPPKPYASWVLNEDSCLWGAPVPMPEEGRWTWNENNVSWKKVEMEA